MKLGGHPIRGMLANTLVALEICFASQSPLRY